MRPGCISPEWAACGSSQEGGQSPFLGVCRGQELSSSRPAPLPSQGTSAWGALRQRQRSLTCQRGGTALLTCALTVRPLSPGRRAGIVLRGAGTRLPWGTLPALAATLPPNPAWKSRRNAFTASVFHVPIKNHPAGQEAESDY